MARISTDEQANSGLSLDAQRAKIQGYADLYDLELVAVVEDAGQSGKTLKREGLQRALTLLRKGKVEGILIAKLDRPTRSVADWQTLIDGHFGDKPGKQLFSVGDSINTRTTAGPLAVCTLNRSLVSKIIDQNSGESLCTALPQSMIFSVLRELLRMCRAWRRTGAGGLIGTSDKLLNVLTHPSEGHAYLANSHRSLTRQKLSQSPTALLRI